MKKKIVSVLLASLMVTSMLAGCGNSSGSSSSSGEEAQEETPPLHPVQKQVTQVSQQKSRKQ